MSKGNYILMQMIAQDIENILRKTNNAKCEYLEMDNEYYGNLACPELSQDNRGNQLRVGDRYMVVTCSNGYPYYVNVTYDSPLTACAEVFDFIQYKF